MPNKLKVRDFNKKRSQSKSYREWKEEEILSGAGLTESVYSTDRHGARKTILDEATEEEFYISKISKGRKI